MGQVPVLYWDGEELAQSAAITRFLARKVGWAGKSDLEFTQADILPVTKTTLRANCQIFAGDPPDEARGHLC